MNQSLVAPNHLPVCRGAHHHIRFFGAFPPLATNTRAISEDLARRLEPLGWATTLVSRQPNRLWRAADLVTAAWRARGSTDVAHVDLYSGSAFRWAEAVTRLLSGHHTPFVITMHGGALPEFMARHPQRVQRVLRRATTVVAPSEYLRQAASTLDVDAQVIPNGIDRDLYPATHRPRVAPQLVWVRAFHQIYQPTLAVEVLARVAQRFPEATLLMVGPDKDGTRQQVEQLAASLGVTQRITFTGGQPKADIPGLLSKGDIFLNTTTIDNMPVSVLEAAACGLCVVSTNVGGVPWLVRDGQEALLVPPSNPEAMTQAVEQLLEHDDLAARLSAAALARASAYDWAPIAARWDALFRSLVTSPVAA